MRIAHIIKKKTRDSRKKKNCEPKKRIANEKKIEQQQKKMTKKNIETRKKICYQVLFIPMNNTNCANELYRRD